MFDLVPPAFARLVQEFYTAMGSPTISHENVWDIYLHLHDQFYKHEHHAEIPPEYQQEWEEVLTAAHQKSKDQDSGKVVELIPNLVELEGGLDNWREDGSYYMGGVNMGRWLLSNTLTTFIDAFSTHICHLDSKQTDTLAGHSSPEVQGRGGEENKRHLVAWFSSDGHEW